MAEKVTELINVHINKGNLEVVIDLGKVVYLGCRRSGIAEGNLIFC